MKINLKNIKVAVELTSICNMSCQMCPYPFMERKKENLCYENLLKINKIIRENGLKVRWLHEMGEPLLYPRLKEALYLFPEAMLSTNGLLLEGEIAKTIIESPLKRIRICIDTINKKNYEILRKGGNFEKVIENTKNFLKLSDGKEIIVEIQKMVSKLTKEEKVKDFEIFFEKEKFKNLKIVEKFCEGLDTTDETILHKKYSGCFQGGPFSWLVFLSNGKITHCCYDYEGSQAIGDLNMDFKDIISNKKIKEIKRAFKEKKFQGLPACQRCFKHKDEIFTLPPFFYKILRKIPFKNKIKKWIF